MSSQRVTATCLAFGNGISPCKKTVGEGEERGFKRVRGAAAPLDAGGYVCDTSINQDPNAPIEYATPIEGSDDENAGGGTGSSLRNRSGGRWKCISGQWARVVVCHRDGC